MTNFTFKAAAVAALLAVSAVASAQQQSAADTSSKNFVDQLFVGLNVGIGTPTDKTTPVNFASQLGWRFTPRFYVFASAEGGACLTDRKDSKTWASTNGIGGGLGYTFYTSGNLSYYVEASALTTVGKADAKHNVYDVRLGQQLGNMALSLGYRHASSRSAGFGASNSLYATIGFRF